MTYPMNEHEAIQPQKQFIKRSSDDVECPTCGGRMARGAKQCRDCRNPRPILQQPDDPSYRLIALTRGKVTEVSTEDYEKYNQWRWAAQKRRNGDFYAVRGVWDGKKVVNIQLHREIMGVTDPKIKVDHRIAGTTLDNRRKNLRIAPKGGNQANSRSFHNVSGYKGVSRVKRRSKHQMFDGWRAEVTCNGKKYASKTVREPEVAARLYDELAIKHHGEFALVNFPEEHGREPNHKSYPGPVAAKPCVAE